MAKERTKTNRWKNRVTRTTGAALEGKQAAQPFRRNDSARGAGRVELCRIREKNRSGRENPPYSYPKRLNFFFFSGIAGWPQIDRVICRIACEIGESSSVSGVAVFCIRRTAA